MCTAVMVLVVDWLFALEKTKVFRQSAFRSISVIPLTQLLIEIRFVSDEGDSVDRYWHESDATTINPFFSFKWE